MIGDGTEFICPSCGSSDSLENHKTAFFVCRSCDSRYILKDHLCPSCFAFSPEARAACTVCGSVLSQQCPQCGQSNWPASPNCLSCGHSLDLLSIIAERYSPDSTARRYATQMHAAKTIKAIEGISSQKRMSDLEMIERARIQRVDRRLVDRKKRDRQLYIISGIILALFVLTLILIGLIQMKG